MTDSPWERNDEVSKCTWYHQRGCVPLREIRLSFVHVTGRVSSHSVVRAIRLLVLPNGSNYGLDHVQTPRKRMPWALLLGFSIAAAACSESGSQ